MGPVLVSAGGNGNGGKFGYHLRLVSGSDWYRLSHRLAGGLITVTYASLSFLVFLLPCHSLLFGTEVRVMSTGGETASLFP